MEEKVNSFQTDDSLKKEKKYKDDYNTFITKLKNNKLKLNKVNDNQTLEELSSKEAIQKNWNQFNNTQTTYSILGLYLTINNNHQMYSHLLLIIHLNKLIQFLLISLNL